MLRGKETPDTQAAAEFSEEEKIDAGVKRKVEVYYIINPLLKK
jgi:hypothetical protein